MSFLGLNFLLPWFLLLLPFAIGLLIYAYRKSGRNAPVLVATTYLLKLLKRAPETKKKFVPPIHFWLELLALITLILAFSNPFITQKKSKYVVLLDDSFSMKAHTLNSSTIFTNAVEAIKDRVIELPADALIKLITTSSECDSSIYLTKLDFLEKIRSCNSTFKKDSFEQVLFQALSENDATKILAFSDKELTENTNFNNLTYFSFRPTQPLNNIVLSQANIEDSKIKILLRSYTKNKSNSKLSIRLGNYANDKIDLKNYAKRDVVIEGGQELLVAVDAPSNLDWQILEFEVEDLGAKYQNDSITEDNKYWLTKDSIERTIAVVSRTGDSTLGLEKIKGLNVKAYNMGTYLSVAEAHFDLSIFDQIVPKNLPKESGLFLLPEGDFVFDRNKDLQDDAIRRWANDSEITTYVNFNLLSGTKGFSIKAPLWAKPIIFGDKGATLVAGEMNGTRYIASGIEFLPYNGIKTPALSVLTLNIIRWLTKAFSPTVNESIYFKDSVKRAYYLTNLKSNESLIFNSTGESNFTPKEPGIIETTSTNNLKALYAVNLSKTLDFDLREKKIISLKNLEKPSALEADVEKDLTKILSKIAFLVLLIDFVIRLIKLLILKRRFA